MAVLRPLSIPALIRTVGIIVTWNSLIGSNNLCSLDCPANFGLDGGWRPSAAASRGDAT